MKKLLLILAIFTYPLFTSACENKIWQGGLWNLDLSFDVSTYGYYRFCLNDDDLSKSGNLLKIEWVEKRDSHPERIYAFRLLEEIQTHLYLSKSLKIKMGSLPNEFVLKDEKNKSTTINIGKMTKIKINK